MKLTANQLRTIVESVLKETGEQKKLQGKTKEEWLKLSAQAKKAGQAEYAAYAKDRADQLDNDQNMNEADGEMLDFGTTSDDFKNAVMTWRTTKGNRSQAALPVKEKLMKFPRLMGYVALLQLLKDGTLTVDEAYNLVTSGR